MDVPRTKARGTRGERMIRDSVTIIDNRNGKRYEFPIMKSTLSACDFRKIKTAADDPGLLIYDPAFTNTASCCSSITFLDGTNGCLHYRGYPIEQLAEKSTYLETAYLLLNGELPTCEQLASWHDDIAYHSVVDGRLQRLIEAFPSDAHPMGRFIASIVALGTLYPESASIFDSTARRAHIRNLIAKVITIAAWNHRSAAVLPFSAPDPGLSYTARFLSMMFNKIDKKETFSPVLERALEALFIVHADHEQNCSTTVMRSVGSAHVDPYSAAAAAAAALHGPLHGGSNTTVIQMLEKIGSVRGVSAFVRRLKEGAEELMGFGHRVYAYYDPRANILKRVALDVFALVGKHPLIDIAIELERIVLEDEHFAARNVYPTVDFYSGLIYQAMGFPKDMFSVLFAIPRMAGWLAQWEEQVTEPMRLMVRPRQIYLGLKYRDYVELANRVR